MMQAEKNQESIPAKLYQQAKAQAQLVQQQIMSRRSDVALTTPHTR